MLHKYLILFIAFCFTNIKAIGIEKYQHILNEPCLTSFQAKAIEYINDTNITIIKEAMGVTIRFRIENPMEEFYHLSSQTIDILKKIEYFLAKIKKPVIIEVHTEVFGLESKKGIKNWELSTVIANKVETFLIQNSSTITKENIKSIGYGEFMPVKNTPNNGGKYSNRIDIIIPCSISGE